MVSIVTAAPNVNGHVINMSLFLNGFLNAEPLNYLIAVIRNHIWCYRFNLDLYSVVGKLLTSHLSTKP